MLFGITARAPTGSGEDLVEAWETGADALRADQGAATSGDIPGPANSSNAVTDSSEVYIWSPPSALAEAIRSFFFASLDASQDLTLRFRVPDVVVTDREGSGLPIEGAATLGEAAGVRAVVARSGSGTPITAAATLGEATGTAAAPTNRSGSGTAITANATLGAASGSAPRLGVGVPEPVAASWVQTVDITDQESLLIQQWIAQPNMVALIRAKLARYQDHFVEVAKRLEEMLSLDDAKGVFLDHIGRRFGYSRPNVLRSGITYFGFAGSGHVGWSQGGIFRSAMAAPGTLEPLGDTGYRPLLRLRGACCAAAWRRPTTRARSSSPRWRAR